MADRIFRDRAELGKGFAKPTWDEKGIVTEAACTLGFVRDDALDLTLESGKFSPMASQHNDTPKAC